MRSRQSKINKQQAFRLPVKIDSVEIIDRNGRKDRQSIRRSLLFIGYASNRRDQKLSIRSERRVKEKEDWCVQLKAHATFCRLNNIGRSAIDFKVENGAQPDTTELLGISAVRSVSYETEIELEGYTFIFYRRRIIPFFEVKINFPTERVLQKHHTKESPLQGEINLKLPKKTTIEFMIKMTIPGMDEIAAYKLDASYAKLIDASEDTVNFNLYHPPGVLVPAGAYEICVAASAEISAEKGRREEALDFYQFLVHPIYEQVVEVDNPFECHAGPKGDQGS